MSVLGTWLEHLAPGSGRAVGDAFGALPLRTVYREPEGPVSADDRTWLGAEWSMRVAADGQVQRARLMVSVDAQRAAAGELRAALAAVDPTLPRLGAALAETLRASRPDLDLLLGADLTPTAARAKLYVLRPAGRPVADFGALTEGVLARAGVPAAWTRRQLDLLGADPAFFALDLHPGGRVGAKLYVSYEEPDEVRRVLQGLGAPSLADRLAAVAVSDNPVGRLVVTVRARGERTADVTLHAHTARVPPMAPPTQAAWQALVSEAVTVLGRPLHPSYVSWLDGGQPSETLYYQVGPG